MDSSMLKTHRYVCVAASLSDGCSNIVKVAGIQPNNTKFVILVNIKKFVLVNNNS